MWTVALVFGALLCVPYVLRATGGSINPEVFAVAIRRMLAAHDASRALRLCRAAPDAFLAAGFEEVLLMCSDGSAVAAVEQADYRVGAVDRSPDAVMARLRARFEHGVRRKLERLRAARVAAAFGALALFAMGVAAMITPGGPIVLPILVALALCVCGNALRAEIRARRFAKSYLDQFADVLYPAAIEPANYFSSRVLEPPRTGSVERGIEPLTFTIVEPGSAPRVVTCEHDVVKIGSHASSQVTLHAERVARMHAVIERTPLATTIIDLGATDGTKVNGVAITKRALRDGDVIAIGAAELRVSLG